MQLTTPGVQQGEDDQERAEFVDRLLRKRRMATRPVTLPSARTGRVYSPTLTTQPELSGTLPEGSPDAAA